jgi:hypothetical protein
MTTNQWLKQAIECGTSWNKARDLYYQGRITDLQWAAFDRVWHWLCFRYSSQRQDDYYNQHGQDAMRRKIDRTRKAFGLSPEYS